MYLNMSAIRIYNNMHKQVIPSGNKSLFYILDVRLLLNVVEKEEKRKGMNVNGTIRTRDAAWKTRYGVSARYVCTLQV